MTKIDIEAANKKVFEIIKSGQAELVDIKPAIDAVPGMTEDTILHAGPPIGWDRMCGPVRGAMIGALLYEGKAKSEEEAEKLAKSGTIKYSPCHHHSAVGPMSGVISASMPVFILKNRIYGNFSYCTLNEGLGKVLRYGAFSKDVIEKLKWMEKVIAPALKEALALSGPIDLKGIIAQAVQMGDECHNRNKAATSLFIRTIAPFLAKIRQSADVISEVFKFMNSNDHFFLNLSMPACKAMLEPAENIEGSTIVTNMSRNGTDFGIRISGLGEKWFTAPAPMVKGLYFPGFSEKDANPDLGDSCITETCSIGGFAMAAAPAIVQFVGSTAGDAINFTKKMYEITVGENNSFAIPVLNFRGTPVGIDIRKVLELDILPQINTGIAHKNPGIGQVGAGLVNPPKKLFEDALIAFAEKYNI